MIKTADGYIDVEYIDKLFDIEREIEELKPRLDTLYSELEILLVAKDENDGKNGV